MRLWGQRVATDTVLVSRTDSGLVLLLYISVRYCRLLVTILCKFVSGKRNMQMTFPDASLSLLFPVLPFPPP